MAKPPPKLTRKGVLAPNFAAEPRHAARTAMQHIFKRYNMWNESRDDFCKFVMGQESA